MFFKPLVLIILDGWGYREETEHNAIAAANTPRFDLLWKNNPRCLLQASGTEVGLPDGQIGTSEVGHTTIGAGAVIDTDLVRIGKAAKSGEFVSNPVFANLFDHVGKHRSTLHLKGLVSPGGVHSHSQHLYELLQAAKNHGLKKVAIHAFLDGRDTPPNSAVNYLSELEQVIAKIGVGFIASIAGRYYAMDRDQNWDRVKRVEKSVFFGQASQRYHDRKPSEVVARFYEDDIYDEFIEPVIFDAPDSCYQGIEKNDGVLFFNFRSDRARMLSACLDQHHHRNSICFVTMTQYDDSLTAKIAFPKLYPSTTLAKEISSHGFSQAHIAETEKFAHATYYLNGGRQQPHIGESHVLVESRKDIGTHDQAPQMRAREIADKAIEHIRAGTDFIFVNFANPDMVGHTGKREAIIKAIEVVDEQLGRVVKAVRQIGGVVLVTADHGNAEVNFDVLNNTPHTAHTANPVPAILVGASGRLKNGLLSDVAPTILKLMGMAKPDTMTGCGLFTR